MTFPTLPERSAARSDRAIDACPARFHPTRPQRAELHLYAINRALDGLRGRS